jgi:hypothetical protein
MAGGAASIVLGLMTLTIQYTMGPTHTWNGVNYANAFNMLMTTTGLALLCLGAWIIVRVKNFKITANRLTVQRRSV